MPTYGTSRMVRLWSINTNDKLDLNDPVYCTDSQTISKYIIV